MAGGDDVIWGSTEQRRAVEAGWAFVDPGGWGVRKEIKWHQWAGEEDGRFAQADLGRAMK